MCRLQQPLTPRQREFFQYLRDRINSDEGPPSLRQAAKELRISHTAVASLLQALREKGWIRKEGSYSRTIALLEDSDAHSTSASGRAVPIIGRVAAGLPLHAQQEWAGSILVDGSVFRGDHLFALRVQGDSMIRAGIFAGDLAICEPRQYAANGEIVVALINNKEATVKRFFYRGDHIELHPENDAYPTTRYALGEILIQGKVIGIQRGPEQMDHVAGQAVRNAQTMIRQLA
ncbi:transcriptional repressor LexA [Desulfobulbus alkaliphilus]|uniref:transcriptional repressor LexA n=1 Tax=Desulfobulbus alkaliphilus TaxID=869814 RepID=UPI0019636905|nr:transcriptional repressor LexA [Desulfobulbus alkaliphilus]MBM9536912.1 transcriptional repressor LexA [Desulfobulbus alkaliphilus]